jgi:hypothetical protein
LGHHRNFKSQAMISKEQQAFYKNSLKMWLILVKIGKKED